MPLTTLTSGKMNNSDLEKLADHKLKEKKQSKQEKQDKKKDLKQKKKEKKAQKKTQTGDNETVTKDKKVYQDGESKKRKVSESETSDAKKPKVDPQQSNEHEVETPTTPHPSSVVLLPVTEWREKIEIEVPPGTPDPYQTFSQLGACPPTITKGLSSYTSPTPVQAQTWPIALGGKDMVGIAPTGSGKTVAFLVPALMRLLEKQKEGKLSGKRPHIVILAPVREIAQQIQKEATTFLAGTSIFTACVYGGDSKSYQIKQLRRGAQLVIATPGRLIDLYGMGHVDFTEVFYLVLDEADCMLDMGFEPQIRQIVELMPTDRQTVMFTATFPKEVHSLAYSFQKLPVLLRTGSENLTSNENITQKVYVVEPFEKYAKLKEVLNETFKDNCRILVFTNTKKACDAMAQRLWDEGLPVNAIHGDLDQGQRNKAIQQFRDGLLPILFATDVAGRGINIPDIKYPLIFLRSSIQHDHIRHVINADFPLDFEKYVHRIGRTGRAEQHGVSHTLICLDSDAKLPELVKFLDQCGQEVPTILRDRFGGKAGRGGYGSTYNRRGRGGFSFGTGPSGSRFDRGTRGGSHGSYGGGRGGPVGQHHDAGSHRGSHRRGRGGFKAGAFGRAPSTEFLA